MNKKLKANRTGETIQKESLDSAKSLLKSEAPGITTASAAELLGQHMSISLEAWLCNKASEWAMQFVDQIFPDAEDVMSIFVAAEHSFRSATKLVCHVLKRGRLDQTYHDLWDELIGRAELDVDEKTADTPDSDAPDKPVADLLNERVSKRTGDDGLTLEHWLVILDCSWALEFVKVAFPAPENESALLIAAEGSFGRATELVIHVIKRGGLDTTYENFWNQLLAEVKKDVDEYREGGGLG